MWNFILVLAICKWSSYKYENVTLNTCTTMVTEDCVCDHLNKKYWDPITRYASIIELRCHFDIPCGSYVGGNNLGSKQ